MENNKDKDYFANLPFKEETVRNVIASLKDSGYFGKTDFDPQTVDLAKMLAPPDQRRGVRIVGLTEGQGKHKPRHMFVQTEYDVPENEVFVTIDDSAPLAGSVTTYRFQRTKDGLNLLERYVHARS